METHRVRPWGFETFLEQNPMYVASVLEEVRTRGALTADELPEPATGIARRIPGAWHASVGRAVLEAHFGRGLLAVADRRPNFARAYDLAERIIPDEHFSRNVTREEAQRELLRQAACGHGIGSAHDLADYYRMPVRDARPRLAELVSAGELVEVCVEGWREVAYLDPNAATSGPIEAAALISPFDPLVWFRPRVARLFNFDYRVEIFVPREKRRWGYYVLPFLLGDRLVARVDLKADRPGCSLQVLSLHVEAHAKLDEVIPALAKELVTMADWLQLDTATIVTNAKAARCLATVLRRSAMLQPNSPH
jgi:uncharacterized protein YcaQ